MCGNDNSSELIELSRKSLLALQKTNKNIDDVQTAVNPTNEVHDKNDTIMAVDHEDPGPNSNDPTTPASKDKDESPTIEGHDENPAGDKFSESSASRKAPTKAFTQDYRIPPRYQELPVRFQLEKSYVGWSHRELHALIDAIIRRPPDVFDIKLFKWASEDIYSRYGVSRSANAARLVWMRDLHRVTKIDVRRPEHQNNRVTRSIQRSRRRL